MSQDNHNVVTVKINGKDYEFADPHQTGRSIKERAGIPSTGMSFSSIARTRMR